MKWRLIKSRRSFMTAGWSSTGTIPANKPFGAVAYYKSLGIKVERVMTDNGRCYKSFAFRDACIELGIKPHPH